MDVESTVISPDGSLVLNIGRVHIVFIYRLIDELMVSNSNYLGPNAI